MSDILLLNKETWKLQDNLSKESPMAYRIFRFLGNNMDFSNKCLFELEVLEKEFNLSESKILKEINFLKEKKFIEFQNIYTFVINNEICRLKEIEDKV